MNPPADCSSPRSLKDRLLRDLPRRIFNSRFLTVSALLHFILVLVFGGTIISRPAPPDGAPEAEFLPSDETTKNAVSRPKGEPEDLAQVRPDPAANQLPAGPVLPNDFLISKSVEPNKPVIPMGVPVSPGTLETTLVSVPVTPLGGFNDAQKRAIDDFSKIWVKPGSHPGKPIKERAFGFTIFLAKYGDPNDPQRRGDWASTHQLKNGKITGGSLPNLAYLMNKLSRGKLEARVEPEPIDLASDQIFVQRPPFIFFTGHSDFVLTEREVENLQRYVNLGGCIWGDSSLPGRRSRFDIAFRREMRRVVPDVDKGWEALPPQHAMFTHNLYFPEVKTTPTGLNFYKEPVYALKTHGEVAVIYTANDYGDLWQIGLDENGKFDFSRDEKGAHVAMNTQIWDRRTTYFRNVAESPVLDSYKFGANIVTHLLTRWESRVGRQPTGL